MVPGAAVGWRSDASGGATPGVAPATTRYRAPIRHGIDRGSRNQGVAGAEKEIGAVMPEQRNLILAIVLSVTIIIAFQYFYELPRVRDAQRHQAQRTEQTAPPDSPEQAAPGVAPPSAPGAVTTPRRRAARRSPAPSGSRSGTAVSRARWRSAAGASTISSCRPIARRPRPIRPTCACSTRRARRIPISPSSAGSRPTRPRPCPTARRVWQADRDELRPDQPVTLSWDNGQGLPSRAPSPSTTPTCSRSASGSRTWATSRSRFIPTA